jgi:hypothetical protein
MENVQFIQDLVEDIAKTDKKGYLYFNVIKYVFLLILYTSLNLYTTQYLGIIVILEKLFTMNLENAKTCRTIYTKFLRNTENLIIFI